MSWGARPALKEFFRGNVIAPLLSLEIEMVNFGVVALGYEYRKEIILFNKTPVPIQYHIEVSDDGFQPAIDCETYLQGVNFPPCPREFSFYPDNGVVDEESTVLGTVRRRTVVIRVKGKFPVDFDAESEPRERDQAGGAHVGLEELLHFGTDQVRLSSGRRRVHTLEGRHKVLLHQLRLRQEDRSEEQQRPTWAFHVHALGGRRDQRDLLRRGYCLFSEG
jgi:hypothetical protein